MRLLNLVISNNLHLSVSTTTLLQLLWVQNVKCNLNDNKLEFVRYFLFLGPPIYYKDKK